LTAELEMSGEQGPDPREALEKFVLDNEDLARLEELTSQFNIFEALGIVRQEIRHSNFLAWLMNPAENHGLGHSFLKHFLLKTSVAARELGIGTLSPIDVDVWDLSATEVRREWKNIDITLLDQSNKFVCVIENKIHSGEHSDQLRRYREDVVEVEFPDYARHYVLLNVTGDEPSDREYVGVTYDEVCDVIERLLEMRASTMGDDLATALSHYVTMVRRRVMPDTEIQELCRRIYRKHQAALDLIYEYRPDLQAEIRDALLEMIKADPDFTLDRSSKDFIRFLPKSWDRPELGGGKGWTRTGRTLLFEFFNSSRWNPNSLSLRLTLGPGDESVRRQIWDAATKAGSPLTPDQRGLTKWAGLFWKEILSTADYDDLDLEAIQSRLQEAWSAFKSSELPPMKEAIDQVFS
jgi:hypothetical protein